MLLTKAIVSLEEYLTAKQMSKETIRSYVNCLCNFNQHLAERYNIPAYLEDVTTEDIEQYMHKLKTENGLQASSVNVHLNGIRSLCKFAVRKKWLEDNPAIRVDPLRVQQKERDFPTQEEVDTLLEEIDHPLINLVVRTLANTGLRISECLNLRVEDVDLEQNRIQVIAGKGNKDRTVPINQSLSKYLIDYKNGWRPKTDSDYFFLTKRTGKLSPEYVNRKLKSTARRLRWKKNISCHSLRHSFASQLVEKGVSLSNVAKLLGHTDFRTVTAVYVHSSMDQMEQAVNQL